MAGTVIMGATVGRGCNAIGYPVGHSNTLLLHPGVQSCCDAGYASCYYRSLPGGTWLIAMPGGHHCLPVCVKSDSSLVRPVLLCPAGPP